MPLLRTDAIPLPREDVTALRARLVEPYQCEVVEREERRYLFVRCPGEQPDPVVDLERGCEEAPAWLVRSLSDVFLLGSRVDLHVPAHYARPIFESLARLDLRVAQEARDSLDVHYGVSVRRVAGDAQNAERLVVRVPRDRCSELSELDLAHLATRIGPLFDVGALRHVRLCHLVAEQDQVRFRSADFLSDLVERWIPVRQAREAAVAPLPAPPPEPPHLQPGPPKTIVDVTPLFEIEVELAAEQVAPQPAPVETPTEEQAATIPDGPVQAPMPEGPATPPEPDPFRDAETQLAHTLTEAGFVVGRAPFLEGSPFQVEGERASAFPRRVALLVRPRLSLSEASEAVQLVREHNLDLLVVLATHPTTDALRRLSASKVKVIKPDEVASIRP